MNRMIRQTVTFRASAVDVYEALMDSRKHARFTGARARISRTVGGKISAYDGYIEGENLELVPNRKIVQRWRASDWPDGHFSKASFCLKPGRGTTRLTFTQTGVPAPQVEAIKKGWIDFYWEPMKAMLEKHEH